jgi:signal transduction histidine kinase
MSSDRILVVEDDAAVLSGVRDTLELAGYQVTVSASAIEALAQLERSSPDLILCDVMMPRMNGYELYEAVRARPELTEVPFIFLTAKGTKKDIRRGKELGVDDYLVKPFDENDLLVAIRNKLHRRAELEQSRQRQMAELKQNILTTLTHEFRTPLTHITTYLEVLQQQNPSLQADEFRSYMDVIYGGAERLQRLVRDFIFLAEIQAGETKQAFESRAEVSPELVSLIYTASQRFAATAQARQISIEVCLPTTPLPDIRLDREYLGEAINRLVENALKFSPPGRGPVILRAGAQEEWVEVAVEDHGVGIKPAHLQSIFQLFYQSQRHMREQQGIGSGLTIAQELVRLHGGRLRVKSELGQGSTFTIELPIFRSN